MQINSIECASNIRNSGFGSCTFTPGFTKGWFRVGKNFKIDATVAASPTTLRAYMQSLLIADDPSQRIYPVHGIKAVTDNSEDTTMQTFADGTQVPVRDGFYNWTYQYIDGGMCLHLALRTWNNTGGLYIWYDQNNTILGTIDTDTDGNRSIVGAEALFYENKWKANDGSNVAAFTSFFSVDSVLLNENLGFIRAGFNLASLKGLETLVLKQGTIAPAAGVLHVAIAAGCDYANQFSLYGTQLADESLWIAKNETTNGVIDITSVTASTANQDMIVTLDTSDPDYPATATAKVLLTLVGPTGLDAADIPGFESNTLTIARG